MLRNIGSNWLITVLTVLSTYVTVPLMVDALGNERYGLWLLMSSVTGYMNLLMLGVPMASVKQFASALADGTTESLNRAFSTVVVLFVGLTVIAFACSGALYLLFLKVGGEAAHAPGAALPFFVLASSISLGFTMLVPVGLLSAHQQFVSRNLISAAIILLRVAAYVVLLPKHPTLQFVAFTQLLLTLLEFLATWLLVRYRVPTLRFSVSFFDRGQTKAIFSFGMWVLVLNAASQLAFQSDSLVISSWIGVKEVPYYSVPNSIIVNAMALVIGIASVVMPLAARLGGAGDYDALRSVFEKWTRNSTSISVLLFGFLYVAGGQFLHFWVGAEFAERSIHPLLVLGGSALIFFPARGVALPVLMGLGSPRAATTIFLVASVANVVVSIALASHFGLLGVALGTALPNVIAAVLIFREACHSVDLSTVRLFRKMMAPQYLVLAITLGLAQLTPMVDFKPDLLHIAFAGMLVTIAISAGLFFTVYRHDPALRGYQAQLLRYLRPRP